MGSLVGFVIRANLHRRHLTTSQRAAVAAGLASMKQGRPEKSPDGDINPITQEDAAKMLNVGKRSVERAKTVLDSGDDKLIEQVKSGEVTATDAAKRVAPPAPAPEPVSPAEAESEKLLRLWDRTSREGRALCEILLKAYGAA